MSKLTQTDEAELSRLRTVLRDARTHKLVHEAGDLDRNDKAMHHTVGPGPGQVVGSPSPWIPIVLASGFAVTSGFYVPSLRTYGVDEIQACGVVTGNFPAGSLVSNQVPVGFRPLQQVNLSVPTNTGDSVRLEFDPTGIIRITAASSGSSFSLDGLTFRQF